MNQIHDLSEGVQEKFEFTIRGHNYYFRHLTTDEVNELMKLQADSKESQEWMYQFITPVKPESPEFSMMAKQMILPEWQNFQKMVKAEFGMKS